MRLAPLYAIGHWITIAVLGAAVIHFKLALPHSLDKVAEHIVGITLIALAAYVFITLLRRSSTGAPKTRMTLLVQVVRVGFWRAKQLFTSETLSKPQPSTWNYDQRSVFALGILHGLGAETPTQLALFALAANLGGAMKGFLGLVMFLAGLLAVNTLIMAAAAGIFGASTLKPWLLKSATAVTAIYSLVVGTIFFLN
jgi:high-affinity nickel-transport protein